MKAIIVLSPVVIIIDETEQKTTNGTRLIKMAVIFMKIAFISPQTFKNILYGIFRRL